MRAIRFHEHGGPEVLRLEDIPETSPGAGEVRVAVKAVSLNHLDLWVRRGLPIRIEMPHIPGTDFAGVVTELGPGATGVGVGDRVVGYPVLGVSGRPYAGEASLPAGNLMLLGEQRNGACCESIVIPAHNVVRIPDALDDVRAAALPVAFTTAWTMLVERAQLREGETVLVVGAGSGVGTAAIQIARHRGARVLAATRSDAKAERLRALGADDVLVGAPKGLHRRVRAATSRLGADVVFEHVGAATWEESVRAVADGGRIVTCGATTGPQVVTDLRHVFARQVSIHGVTLGNRSALETILALAARGAVDAVIDEVMPLSACRRAHEILEAGEVFGKIVLSVAGESGDQL